MIRTYQQRHLTLIRNISVMGMFMALALGAADAYVRVSHAATASVAAEAEAGTRAGATVTVSGADASGASGGSAVRFGGSDTAGACIAPAGAKVQDQSPDDYAIPPWRHKLGSKAVVYFQTSGLPAEYAGYINDGLNTWNQSVCIDARAVETCPSNTNCVVARVSTGSGGGADGEYSEQTNGAETIMLSGTLTFYKSALDGESTAQRRVTTIHEMGHAVSLSHRNTRTAIMYGSSGPNVSLNPDAIDLANLLAIYGKAGDATAGVTADTQGVMDMLTNNDTMTRTFQ